MPLKTAFREIEEALLAEVRRHYGGRLVSLVIYGSAGRGTMRPDSDIDALIVAEGLPAGRIPSLAKAYLKKATARVDVLALKGMLRYVGVEPPKWHDVGGILVEHAERFPGETGASLRSPFILTTRNTKAILLDILRNIARRATCDRRSNETR